jgi:hypothetical protein
MKNENTDTPLKADCPSATCSLRTSELLEIREAIWAAMDDIGEHLQVAKYNLRGECCGQIMARPNPPRLIHEAGIKVSEDVKERLRLISCKISAVIKAENS